MNWPGRGRAPKAGGAALAEYLYVPCTRICRDGGPAGTGRQVRAVPVVKKTARWIYYASDSWNRREAVVGPGRISREQFEADCPGYPAGVVPVPGDRRPGPAGLLFFATRQAAEDHLHRVGRGPAGQSAGQAPPRPALIRQLRRAMADAHPDRGGTVEQFIQARRRYQTALRAA